MRRSEELLNTFFTQTGVRDGYDERAVDELLDRAVAALRYYEGGGTPGQAPMTAADLESTEVTRTRLRRGYDADEVDALLRDVVATLRHYESGGRPVPVPPSPVQRPTEPRRSKVVRFLRGERD
ncbi:MAG TPA: DivIVA domain-containing protein [Phycicoccus sp.]|nr:DivIVA domain-containing protein [Phycicoccus sp.]